MYFGAKEFAYRNLPNPSISDITPHRLLFYSERDCLTHFLGTLPIAHQLLFSSTVVLNILSSQTSVNMTEQELFALIPRTEASNEVHMAQSNHGGCFPDSWLSRSSGLYSFELQMETAPFQNFRLYHEIYFESMSFIILISSPVHRHGAYCYSLGRRIWDLTWPMDMILVATSRQFSRKA
jgi:hypothetical protein